MKLQGDREAPEERQQRRRPRNERIRTLVAGLVRLGFEMDLSCGCTEEEERLALLAMQIDRDWLLKTIDLVKERTWNGDRPVTPSTVIWALEAVVEEAEQIEAGERDYDQALRDIALACRKFPAKQVGEGLRAKLGRVPTFSEIRDHCRSLIDAAKTPDEKEADYVAAALDFDSTSP